MKVKEAIEFLEWLSDNTPYTIKYQNGEDFIEIAGLLQKLEKENIELKETIKNLREEGEKYDKKLNRIDEMKELEIIFKGRKSKMERDKLITKIHSLIDKDFEERKHVRFPSSYWGHLTGRMSAFFAVTSILLERGEENVIRRKS